ncbi:hypothetical protein GCM10011608_36230 [Micromonospora sonchi]|uniref:Uncharacterized protein n=1 Tax=Micromonospora sonchi TaxID=1763543 RepID=A0A917U1H1_9ACTN|nr:hypothetical protein GCM10011608_36230 [Micromonospora sonchi]
MRTASATAAPTRPQESRNSAGNRVNANANAPAAGRSTVSGADRAGGIGPTGGGALKWGKAGIGVGVLCDN